MTTIPLSRGKVAIVDSEDFERLSKHRWHCSAKGYAARSINRKGEPRRCIFMHREIAGAAPEMEVDHINLDKLDNRKANLRPATHAQNAANGPARLGSSVYRGVVWDKRKRKWLARVKAERVGRFLGYFEDEAEAARAYDAAARARFGDFARLNFGPQDGAIKS